MHDVEFLGCCVAGRRVAVGRVEGLLTVCLVSADRVPVPVERLSPPLLCFFAFLFFERWIC